MEGSLPNKHSLMPKQLGGKISGIHPKLPLIQSHLPFIVDYLPLPLPHTYNTCLTYTPDTFVTLSLLDSHVCDTPETPDTLDTLDQGFRPLRPLQF